MLLGIFKPAYLVTLGNVTDGDSELSINTPPTSPLDATPYESPVFIEESSIDIYKLGQNFSVSPDQTADWVVNVSLALRSAKTFPSPVLTLSVPELHLKSHDIPLSPINRTTENAIWVQATWQIADNVPKRWFPHNLGTPKLYNLTVALDLQPSNNTDANILSRISRSGPAVVSFTTTTGFRTIELIQSPYSQEDVEQSGITPGDQWHFKINGKKFYSKGTNIIPFDPFYARTTSEDVRWVLESAVKSGQNMVRRAYLLENLTNVLSC